MPPLTSAPAYSSSGRVISVPRAGGVECAEQEVRRTQLIYEMQWDYYIKAIKNPPRGARKRSSGRSLRPRAYPLIVQSVAAGPQTVGSLRGAARANGIPVAAGPQVPYAPQRPARRAGTLNMYRQVFIGCKHVSK